MRGRIRTVKPELFKSEKLWDLQQETGLPVTQAFIGLWCYADREGRFEWKPRALKSDVLPYWDGDMSAVLAALASKSFVIRYVVNGKEYGYIRAWKEHQRPDHREAASVLPDPAAHGVVAPCLGRPGCAEESPGDARVEGKGMEGNGREQEGRARARVATDVPETELMPHEKAELRKQLEPPSGTMPAGKHQFRDDWKPKDSHRAYGREIGLTDAEMLERAEHCRLKLYPHPFTSEDKQFKRELLWLRNEKETRAAREQRKANPHGFNENPGARRRPGDASTGTVFGSIAAGQRPR